MNQPSTPILSAIAAMANNRVIGRANQLPWHLPADLKHFKALTLGHPIIMGRNTYLSIGRPLPQRTNIILTRNPAFSAPGCVIATNLDSALRIATPLDNEVFIIGGADIYRQLLPHVQRLYLTIIEQAFEGDAFFPDIDLREWHEIANEYHAPDTDNPYPYRFIQLEREVSPRASESACEHERGGLNLRNISIS